ncbi:hypothetical protein NS283_01165 [Microbacterium testaceum]|nr:hypothetical protein NS283_01165 [Microbacterium testaceum]
MRSLRRDDVLSQWMAHHLAQRLTALDHVAPSERKRAEDEVADLILRIWEHGRQEGFVHDPVRLSASVARAVAKLDPEPDDLYYQAFGFIPRPENSDTEVDKYLRLAVLLDRDVGRLIRSLIVYAATVAEDHEAEWIRLLRNIDQDPLLLIRDLSTLAEDTEDDNPEADRLAAARLASTVRALLAPLADEAPPQSTSRSRRLRLTED